MVGSLATFGLAANASFMPGSISGGGDFYGFGNGDISSVLGGEVDDIFGDVVNGDFGSILGTVTGEESNGAIGDVVGSVMGGNTDGLFENIFGSVAGQLGLPPEIVGVITGSGSISDLLGSVLDDAMKDVGLGEIMGGGGANESNGSVIGSQGIPVYDDLMSVLRESKSEKQIPDIGENIPTVPAIGSITVDRPDGGTLPGTDSEPRDISPTGALGTPYVNSTLTTSTQATAALTEAVTARGLSREGQELTEARNKAGDTVVEMSGEMSDASTKSVKARMDAAIKLGEVTKKQKSTQDTLKEALSGLNVLQAQGTQLDAYANNQRALSNQIDAIDLQVSQEARDGTYTTAKGVQRLNEQTLQDSQRELAERSAAGQAMGRSLRQVGVMR